MAEDRLYHSVVAEASCAAGRYVVYGNKLKPFCLLHSLQLSQLGNPLWVGGSLAEPEDLMAAARICASHRPVLDFPAPDYTDPVKELDTWTAYMETCAASPMLKERMNSGNCSQFGTPVEIMAAVKLMRTLGISERRAWTMPYGLVWWYIETANEQETGESYILTREEAEWLESYNTPENIEARRVRDEAVEWIVKHISDPQERARLLEHATLGTLPDNWKEAHNG